MSKKYQSISILIVEDDKLFSLDLERNLSTLEYQVHKEIPRDTQTAWKLVTMYRPNLTIIDIHLEKENAGLELAGKLADEGLPYLLITCDSSDEVFEKARQLNPYSYLVKPFGPKRLHRAIQLLLDQYKLEVDLEEKVFFAKDRNGEFVRIMMADITMVEAFGNYTYLYFGKQRYSLRTSLAKFMRKLPSTHFIQIHRRYIVAIDHVISLNLDADTLTIEGHELHIGGKFKPAIEQRLKYIGR